MRVSTERQSIAHFCIELSHINEMRKKSSKLCFVRGKYESKTQNPLSLLCVAVEHT